MKIQNLQLKKWYIIDNESKGNYSHHNSIKLLTKSINQVFVIILMHIF